MGERSRIGKVLGPSIPLDAVPDALEAIVDVFVEQRHEEEPFILTYERIGKDKFKERVYATGH